MGPIVIIKFEAISYPSLRYLEVLAMYDYKGSHEQSEGYVYDLSIGGGI
jgi:hypothetical protein